jgi:hypothetical protein
MGIKVPGRFPELLDYLPQFIALSEWPAEDRHFLDDRANLIFHVVAPCLASRLALPPPGCSSFFFGQQSYASLERRCLTETRPLDVRPIRP